MEFVLMIVGIFVIFMIIGWLATRNEGKNPLDSNPNYKHISQVKMSNAKNQAIFNKLVSIFESGLPMKDWCEANNEEYKNMVSCGNNVQPERDKDYISALSYELWGNRDHFIKQNFAGIILKPQEEVCYYSQNAQAYSLQNIAKKITYSGVRSSVGGLKMGNGTVYSNEVQGFKMIDYGSVTVTNQRIVFKGDGNKNKVITLGQVLSYAPYQNTGIIFSISNQTPVIIDFMGTGYFRKTTDNLVLFYDEQVQMLLLLDKIFNK